jgi:hypothetical protein
MPEAPWIPAAPSAAAAMLPPTPVGVAGARVTAAALLPPTPVGIAGLAKLAAAQKWQIDPVLAVPPFVGWGLRLGY